MIKIMSYHMSLYGLQWVIRNEFEKRCDGDTSKEKEKNNEYTEQL